jgi:autotransporter-associated beta strand protein
MACPRRRGLVKYYYMVNIQNQLRLLLTAVMTASLGFAQVVINEIQSSNDQTCLDQDGDASDWIELYNTSAVPADIAGWGLSDDTGRLFKWAFPSNTTIAAGSFLRVFASGKDRTNTVVSADSGVAPDSLSGLVLWLRADDVSSFGPGGSVTNWADASGMGNSAYQMVATNAPTYVKGAVNSHAALNFKRASRQIMYLPTANFNGMQSFTNATMVVVCKWNGTATSGILGVSGYDKANAHWEIQTGGTLRWRCADANVQLSKIATSNAWMSLAVSDDSMRETPTVTILRDGVICGAQEMSFGANQGFGLSTNEQLVIGSSHATLISERAFDGQIAEVIWYNRALTAAERTGLSLFLAKKYAMPFQGGSVTTELHTNFSLGSEGETLTLTKRNGEAADKVTFGALPCDTSYGRSPDGADTFVWFAEPTPADTNAAAYAAPLAQPTFSRERGIYNEPVSLALSYPNPAVQIRYTLDLTEPSLTNGFLYASPINITNTTVVRAKAIKAGTLPCRNIATHSFIYLDDVAKTFDVPSGCPAIWSASGTCPAKYGISTNVVKTAADVAALEAAIRAVPVVCINAPWPDLFDAGTGLYTHPTTDGLEALVSAEWLTNGAGRVQIDAGLRIQGAASREFGKSPKKSFRLAFRGRYGSSKLRSRVLEEGGCDVDEFDSLSLRAEYNNSWIHSAAVQRARGSFVRDQWARDTQNVMSGYGSRGSYVQLFINGRYWGLYNIAQRIDDSFAATTFGGEKEDYDAVALGVSRDGDLAAWSATLSLVAKTLSDNAAYEAAAAYVDLERLADYMLINFYGANNDWPGNNWSCVRKRADGEKWSFCCWDVERTLEGVNDSRLGSYSSAGYGPAYFHTCFAANAEYKLLFADRVHKHLFNGGALTPAVAITRYSNLCERVEGAIYGEAARWGAFAKEANGYSIWSNATQYYGVVDWITERDRVLGTYLPQRTAIFLGQLKAQGLYPAIDAPEFSSAAAANGQTVSLTIPTGTTVYFTTDGSDPRMVYTGAVSANAFTYSEPLTIITSTSLRARAVSNGVWSAISELAVKLGTDKAVFIQTDEGNWDKNENWSTGVFPNAAGAWAVIHAPESLDTDGKRNVRINKSAITIGHIELENGSATNRICNKKDAIAGSNLTFNGNGEAATLAVLDQGVGMTLIDVDYGAVLATDLRLVVSNYTGNADYGALKLQGSWSGAGGLIKDGPGLASVTGDGKAYTGATFIKEGVLAFTAKAIPTATPSLTVEAGGQLRLISDSVTTNAFPCPVSLTGFGCDDTLAGVVKGISGALRFDPLNNNSTAIFPAAVTVKDGTGIHVDGSSNTLLLTGGISGSGGLRKTGGGTLGLALAVPVNVGAVSGTGTLACVAGTLVAPSLSGVKLASRLYAAGLNALASNGLAQVGGFCEPAALAFYIDTPTQGVFYGGLFVPLSEPLASRLESLPVTVYIRDSAGTNNFAGTLWSQTNATVSASPVCWNSTTGRVVTVAFGTTAGPYGYSAWRVSTFGTADDSIAGPLAMTDNIPNLFRYAFGMSLADSASAFYPHLSDTDGACEYRVRLNPGRDDLRYLIEATDSLSDWSHAELLFDSDTDIPETLDASGWLALPDSKRSPTRFYRLKVLLKDFE